MISVIFDANDISDKINVIYYWYVNKNNELNHTHVDEQRLTEVLLLEWTIKNGNTEKPQVIDNVKRCK